MFQRALKGAQSAWKQQLAQKGTVIYSDSYHCSCRHLSVLKFWTQNLITHEDVLRTKSKSNQRTGFFVQLFSCLLFVFFAFHKRLFHSKMKLTIAFAGLASVAAFAPSAFVGRSSVSHSAASASALSMKYKVAVVGGGPSGACAAEIFAQEKNIDTFLFERKLDNAKPCGGAIPLCMVGEFNLPESVVDRKVCTVLVNTSLPALFRRRRLAFIRFHFSYGALDHRAESSMFRTSISK